MKLIIYDITGNPTGEEVELSPQVFDTKPNDHAIAIAVQVELTNRRQGTHSTKNRSMVRGGGRKPWRQKGRGAARAGTNRSPLWRGGGITFGPQPHPYRMKINKKVKRLARKSALTYKLREEQIRLLVDFDWKDGKTIRARTLLKMLEVEGPGTLLLTGNYQPKVLQACKNIAGLTVSNAVDVSTNALMKSRTILMQKSALSALTEVLTK